MAFGFPASHIQYIPYNHLSRLEFLYYSIKACQKLNWSILAINENELIAETNPKQETWNEKITISFENEDGFILSSSNENQIYDKGRNLKNTDSFFDVFNDLKKEQPTTTLDQNNITETINSTKESILNATKKEYSVNNFYSFLSIFTPAKGYFITPILIYINFIIFFLMVFSGVNFFKPQLSDIINWGANYNLLTVENQWWRLFSCLFIHLGFFHLLVNCIALGYVGLLIESYLTRLGFLVSYISCGLLASLSTIYWYDKIISAGASGAIFGMYGILLVIILTKSINRKLTSNTITLTIVFIILNIIESFKEGVDGAAHIGGLLSGLFFGIILTILNAKRKVALISISVISLIAIPLLSYNIISKKVYVYQFFEYENKMQEFIDMEKMALEAYNVYVTDEESKKELLYMIESRGIYYWEENIKLMKEADLLYLPQENHKQIKSIIQYCQLRIKLYRTAYLKIKYNSNRYDEELDNLNLKIADVLNKLNKDKKE